MIPTYRLRITCFLGFFVLLLSVGDLSAVDWKNVPDSAEPRFVMTGPVWPQSIGDGDICLWQDDLLAAATITIDDNHCQDHAWWSLTAKKYGVRFTWFVITDRVGEGSGMFGNWSDFVALQSEGHDIQSHSRDHFPNFPKSGPLSLLENYSESITAIESSVPGSRIRTFAYPFGLKEPPNDAALATQHYNCARGVIGLLNAANQISYLNVNSLSTDGYEGGFPLGDPKHFAYIPGLLDPESKSYRGWLCIHSHGVTPEKMNAITDVLDHLTDPSNAYWIAPYTEVALYAQERDTATLRTQVLSGEEEIRFTLTDKMDDTSFDQPLTVKIRIDNSWEKVVVTQAGESLETVVVEHEGNRFALVRVIPDRGTVSITPLK